MKVKFIFSIKKIIKNPVGFRIILKREEWFESSCLGCVWLHAPLIFMADLTLSAAECPGRNQPFQALVRALCSVSSWEPGCRWAQVCALLSSVQLEWKSQEGSTTPGILWPLPRENCFKIQLFPSSLHFWAVQRSECNKEENCWENCSFERKKLGATIPIGFSDQ